MALVDTGRSNGVTDIAVVIVAVVVAIVVVFVVNI